MRLGRADLLVFTLVLMMYMVVIGCETTSDEGSDGDDTTDGDVVSDGDGIEDGDTITGDYPEGPYGYALGETMANFTMTDCDGNAVSLSDFYGTAKAILINRSAGWCSVCRNENEAGTLEEWYQDLADSNIVIIQTLFENNGFQPATEEFGQSWRDQYGLTFPVLIEENDYLLEYHPSIQNGDASFGTPLNIVLDENMVITYLSESDVPLEIKSRLENLSAE